MTLYGTFEEAETRCLRLQHQAELKWLTLRGCPQSQHDQIIEARQKLRSKTLLRYQQKEHDAYGASTQAEKRVRRFDRLLAQPPKPWIRRNAQDRLDWERLRAQAQEEHDRIRAECVWLGEIVRGLSPWMTPELIIRKERIGDRASDAVKTFVRLLSESVA
ncbi:hypothetical protein V5O48_014127 [Marasmius crinis-equi]|uniref:Uncharacterized protein n=1 Tax=Marasmius crinis-equi TaxID=585013 RepID=A0ABR3EY76_9AGAR